MPRDPLTLATKAFNTPLMIDPAKAAVIARRVGPEMLKAAPGLEVAAPGVAPGPEHERKATERASMVGDEVHRVLRQRGGGYGVHRGIAVVPVIGTLVRRGSWIGQNGSGMTSYEGISAQIRAAVEDPEVRGIALEIDSFGGEAAGIFKLMAEIRAARDVKPVRAFVADFAASAGYAIASQAERISVPPFGQAGSIGVVTMHVDIEAQLEQQGMRVTLIHSGARKVDGNPFEALPDRVRAEIQRDNDALWARFAEEVALGRRGAITKEGALRTEAAVFRGIAAVQAGLADEVEEASAAFAAWADELDGRTVAVTGRRRGRSRRAA